MNRPSKVSLWNDALLDASAGSVMVVPVSQYHQGKWTEGDEFSGKPRHQASISIHFHNPMSPRTENNYPRQSGGVNVLLD